MIDTPDVYEKPFTKWFDALIADIDAGTVDEEGDFSGASEDPEWGGR